MSRRNRCFNWDMRLYGTAEGWWDPSDSDTVTIATGVSQLDDKSGNARNLEQATTSKQPAVLSGDLNGKDTISYDATDDCLAVPSSTSYFNCLHDGTSSHIFAIWKPCTNTNPNTVVILFDNNNSSSSQTGTRLGLDDRSSMSRNDTILAYITTGSGVSINCVSPNNELTPVNEYKIVSITIDADASSVGDRTKFRVDNSTETGSNTATAAPSTGNASQDFTVAANGGVQTKTAFGIVTGEIIIYSALSANYSTTFINTLINHKWGVY